MKSPTDTSFVLDISSLDRLRAGVKTGKEGEKASLQAAAEQFEAIFTQMMFKSMREANSAFESDLMSSRNAKFFEQMHDEQMASELSRSNSLGLADMIVQQLGAHQDDSSPQLSDGTLAKEQRFVELDNGGKYLPFERQEFNPDNYTELSKPHFSPVAHQHEAAKPAMSEEQITQIANKAIAQRHAANNGVSAPSVHVPSSPRPESFDSPQAFVSHMAPYARRTASALGVDPAVLIAQAALETGWGKKVISNAGGNSNNLFNIKADPSWKGEKMATQTLEYHQGIAVQERAAFRSYDSFDASFNDYAQFLKQNPRYSVALENTQDPKAFINEIHKAGYATDPRYSEKVMRVFDQVNDLMSKEQ
ncbi:flagellar assembly peptidoglycan hydrolase FlgJ [Photobacterium lutimaris]|uniref:Peptidoglycan hydrolase FlgJ n=1 Tax=Photobacterium lutimaris TaxID=388278 RepID=A0A2T3INI4_9GAMM|nr:flagellar assembly peptidoglycan hydrolase FlgJ [Photobacterium lutimaris]PSU29909.1 flagellar assembly peptidoglycan hydrolase FlgJ [Photobacterium lutimaris]TDR75337.1 flagellar protein FlgJ [Photobacterium lutimaris]